MLAIVDYGVGNLFSLACSLKAIGVEAVLTGEAEVLTQADHIILPGVGAFGDAANALRRTGLDRAVLQAAERGTSLLGLGLISGCVQPIRPVVPADYKVPHMGWNGLHFPKGRPASPLFRLIQEGNCVYFVHSYYGTDCEAHTIATAEYGPELTAAVARDNIYGVQFHPEKSGSVGLNILRAFCEL